MLGERVDEDRAANRMPDDDRAVVQRRQLLADRMAPRRVARIIFGGHPRVADLVPFPERAPEAVDQLVVPLVMRAFAGALDEQDLPRPGHDELGQGTRSEAGREVPLNRSRSTGPLMPGTVPVLECCQNVQPEPPQPAAGTLGWLALVQWATHSTA